MKLAAKNVEQLCPLCGQSNDCALSRGQSIETCWCSGVKFSKDTLDSIPEAEKLTRCLCPACAKATGAPSLAR